MLQYAFIGLHQVDQLISYIDDWIYGGFESRTEHADTGDGFP